MKSTVIRNGIIVTMNSAGDILRGDLRFADGKIQDLGVRLAPGPDEVVFDAGGAFVIPGLIQVHTHLCQTLFRGLADDLELLDWLKEKIWPFESAHDVASMRAAARLGLLEMQLLGTTAILDMGSTRHHEPVFEEADRSGIRYWGGNCLMDLKNESGPLYRPTNETLAYCEELISHWHKRNSRIEYAVCPRFVISCTEKMLKAAVRLKEKHNLIFHTHASENKGEIALVKKRTKLDNIQYLKKIGCLSPQTVIAHAIHINKAEVSALAQSGTGVAHCPSSNLKLASGIARITELLGKGVKVGLGADGAPCNNLLDPFMEMRLAALLQKPLFGPTALPAKSAFELATTGGAKVLNAADRIGSLEKGKCADIVIVERQHPSCATVDDPYSALVYSCSSRDVSHVWTNGVPIVARNKHLIFDRDQTIQDARHQIAKILSRIGH